MKNDNEPLSSSRKLDPRLTPLPMQKVLINKFGKYDQTIQEVEREFQIQPKDKGNLQNLLEAQTLGFLANIMSGFDQNPLKDFEDAKFASKSHGLITSYSANTH